MRPARRVRLRLVAWAGVAVVVVVGGALAVRLATSNRPHAGGTAALTTTGAVATSTPASTSPPPQAVAGQTQKTPDGGTITLLAYAGGLQAIGGDAPPPAGQSFATLELQVCAGSGAPTSVTPYDFVLVEPDQSIVDTLSTVPGAGRQPELLSSELPPGQCVTGWLSFQLSAAAVTLTDTADNLSWPIG